MFIAQTCRAVAAVVPCGVPNGLRAYRIVCNGLAPAVCDGDTVLCPVDPVPSGWSGLVVGETEDENTRVFFRLCRDYPPPQVVFCTNLRGQVHCQGLAS